MIAGHRGLRTLLLATGTLAICSLGTAHGHLAEFILARVTPGEGRVALELTIDCSGDSMISSEAEAREVLGKVLRVRVNGDSDTRELGALAPLQFERRTQIDPAAPVPRDPEEDARPHRLLCATWSWECAGKKLNFEVPGSEAQSVILWTPAAQTGQQPRWVMLLGGDVSPEFAITKRSPAPWILGGASVGLLGACVPVLRRWRRRAL